MYCCTPKALYNHVGVSSTTTSVQHPLGWDLRRNAGEFPEGRAVSGSERERITCVTTCVRLFASEIVSCLKLYCDTHTHDQTHTHTHTRVQIPQSVTAGKTNIDQHKFPFWSRIFYAIQFELDSLKSSKQDCILCMKYAACNSGLCVTLLYICMYILYINYIGNSFVEIHHSQLCVFCL